MRTEIATSARCAADHVVIDVRVIGYPISGEAVCVVNAIAGRNRL